MILKLLAFGVLGFIAFVIAAIVVPVLIASFIVVFLCWLLMEAMYKVFPNSRPRVMSLNEFEKRMEAKYDLD